MAHISFRPRLGALGAGMLLAATAAAQNKPTAPNTASPTTNAAAPAVAEQADRFVKEMSAYIGSANEFTFHADVTFDRCAATFNTALFSVRPT